MPQSRPVPVVTLHRNHAPGFALIIAGAFFVFHKRT